MKRFLLIISYLILMGPLCLFLMGPGPGGCMGGSGGGVQEGLELDAGEGEGGSQVGNPILDDGEWGGSQAGNPEGGSQAGNPAQLVLAGSFSHFVDQQGVEKCEANSVVVLGSDYVHQTPEVSAPPECGWESAPIDVGALEDAEQGGKALAVVVPGENFSFSVPHPFGKDHAFEILTTAQGPGEVERIDLGVGVRNAETGRYVFQFEPPLENIVNAEALDDDDGDGIPNAFDLFDNNLWYDWYNPEEVIEELGSPGLAGDQFIYFCPKNIDSVMLQVKKHFSELDLENNIELIIHYSIKKMGEPWKFTKELTKGSIGIEEAGYLKTSGTTKYQNKDYFIECAGKFEQKEQMTLNVRCDYTPQSGKGIEGSCTFKDAVRHTLDPSQFQKDTFPLGKEPAPVIKKDGLILTPKGTPAIGDKVPKPLLFP